MAGEAFFEVIDGRVIIVRFADLAGRESLGGLRVLDLAGGKGTALWDFSAVARGRHVGLHGWAGWLGVLVAARDIDNVELATGGLLSHKFLGWVVRDVVAVNDVVVPVARAELQSIGALEAEGAFP